MKIAITGGSGFIGSSLVNKLSAQGHSLNLLFRNTDEAKELKRLNFHAFKGDILEIDTLNECFKGMDVVYHLAGFVGYNEDQRKIMEQINIEGTKNVVIACQKSQVKRLIYFSSVSAIGAGFTETEILNEDSKYNLTEFNLGYFETKRIAEEFVRNEAFRNKIDAICLNPSTVYGPGDALKGSRKTQIKVAQGKFPLSPPGGQSIVDIDSVVDAAIAAITLGKSGERYILSGQNLLIKEVFKIIANAGGHNPPKLNLNKSSTLLLGKFGVFLKKLNIGFPFTMENAWVSVLYHYFDSSKAKRELNFNPKTAEYALTASVNWMKENGII